MFNPHNKNYFLLNCFSIPLTQLFLDKLLNPLLNTVCIYFLRISAGDLPE